MTLTRTQRELARARRIVEDSLAVVGHTESLLALRKAELIQVRRALDVALPAEAA